MKSTTFIAFNIAVCIVFIIGIVFDHIFYNSPIITNTAYILNWASPLIVAICAMIITAISLSLTLQNEEIYGLKMREFAKLRQRVTKYYSFQSICVIFVVLIALLVICYFSTFYISCFVVLGMMLALSLYIIIDEIPIILHKEKQINQILALYANEYLGRIDKAGRKDDDELFFKLLTNMLLTKDINYILSNLGLNTRAKEKEQTDENNKNIEKEICGILLGLINTKVFELKNCSDANYITNYYNKVLNKVNFLNIDDLLEKLDYDKSQAYLITRCIFAIRNNIHFDSVHSALPSVWISLVDKLMYARKQDLQGKLDFYFILIQSIIIYSVNKGDLFFLEILLKIFTKHRYKLSEDHPCAYLFVNICMYLNYLLNIEEIYPVEYKKALQDLIQQETHVIGNDEVLKFDELQKYLNSPYGGRGLNIKLDKIMHYFNLCNWEYFINNKIKFVVISDEYIVDWYLIQNIKINENCFNNVVDDIAKIKEKPVKRALHSVLSKWFNADKITLNLSYFKKYEKTELNINDTVLINDSGLYQYIFNALFKLYNNLQLDYVEEVTKQSSAQDNKEIETRLLNDIKAKLESAYGYDPNIKITNDNKMLIYTPIEKDVRVINFFEAHAGSCWQSILLKIQQQTSDKCSILDTSHNINANIENLKKGRVNISNDFNFEYDGIKYISEENKNYIDTIEHQQSLNFPQNFYFNKDCYGFNYKIDEFSVNKLSDEELEQCISWYQKDDGQYYYHGAYMNRVQIAEQVKKVYITLKIVFRIEIKCDKEHCFILNIDNYKQKQQ